MPAAILAFSVYGVAAPADGQTTQSQDHPSTGAAHPDQGTADTAPSGTAAPKTADGTGTFSRPNDWQSQADPDGMQNGGVDQSGGTGGTIGSQDGNNGSGNDADCEDDNRGQGVPGHCKDKRSAAQPTAGTPAEPPATGGPTGHAPAASGPAAAVPAASGPAATVPAQSGPAHSAAQPVAEPLVQPLALSAQVLGTSAVRPRTQPHLAVPGQVAGISASLQPSGGLLPNTGAGDLAPLGAAGVALVSGSAGLLLWRRRLAG